MSGLRRLAAAAPPPVLALAGAGGAEIVADLRATAAVRIVTSPRHATVLLATGGFAGTLGSAAAQIHDQLPHPRVAVWVPAGPRAEPPPIRGMVVVDVTADVAEAMVTLHRDVVTGARPSSPDVLPDVEPNEWRGIGPYGQGGKGMTGGVPYGRPLPGRAPDRDGLELDQLVLRLGPWSPSLPRGLVLDVGVQGDVIQTASVAENPFPAPPPADLFARALSEPVPIAALERARAVHHLRWAAEMLRLLGLDALAERMEHAAGRPGDDAGRLARRLARSARFRPALRGLGVVEGSVAAAVGGPVARAAGHAVDARTTQAAYDGLGFSPVVVDGGDAWSRWVVRLEEAARSIGMADAAGGRLLTPTSVVESPRGPIGIDRAPPSALLLDALPQLLIDREWGDAMVAVASLDLDVEEAAVGAPTGA